MSDAERIRFSDDLRNSWKVDLYDGMLPFHSFSPLSLTGDQLRPGRISSSRFWDKWASSMSYDVERLEWEGAP